MRVNILAVFLSYVTCHEEFIMRRHDIMTLKLRMGISPSARIDPNMLLAMWQQLQLERRQTELNLFGTKPHSNQVRPLQWRHE